MNTRLIAYLRSLGLDQHATDDQAWEFFNGLRGLQSSIANALNYNEQDQAARTNCDLMIRALGYNPEKPSEILPNEVPATQRQTGTDGASAAGDLERARAEGVQLERARVASIEELAAIAGTPEDIVRTLVGDPTITVDVARKQIFDDHTARTRANVPLDQPVAAAIHSRNSISGVTVEILEAAMLHRSGIDPTKGWYRDDNGTPTPHRAPAETLARAADQAWQFRRLSLEDMIRMAAAIDRVNLPMGRVGLLEAYVRNIRTFSTAALVNIFTTNMNSQLLAAYEAAPDSTTGGWIREADVSDFKTNERARMAKGSALEKLPRGSEASHTTFEDSVESYKIARYARQFVVDDQDIVDDTFGGINQHAPSDMGEAARQLRPDLVYSILIGNPSMRDSVALFHADHSNLNTSSALGTAGKLEAARKAMRILQENGRNLNLSPDFLIVPQALQDTAEVLLNSRLLIGDTVQPENNPNYRKIGAIVSDSRLDNGVTDPTDPTGATVHSGSATTWFLSARASAHTIEVGYLRGTGRVPQTRSFVLTEGRWGIGWDIKMDIGAKALNWLGLSKATA